GLLWTCRIFIRFLTIKFREDQTESYKWKVFIKVRSYPGIQWQDYEKWFPFTVSLVLYVLFGRFRFEFEIDHSRSLIQYGIFVPLNAEFSKTILKITSRQSTCNISITPGKRV